MIELFLALLLVPSLVIYLWEKFVSRLSTMSWAVYRATGLIGTPVHEMAHALACLIFGLRITSMSLYSPNTITGSMGFVRFSYSPGNLRHALGMAVQGIAPLIVGSLAVVLGLGVQNEVAAPSQGVVGIAVWLGQVASVTLNALTELVLHGLIEALAAALLLIVALHAIPSWADIKIGLKGLVLLLILGGSLVVGLEAMWASGASLLGRDAGDYLMRAAAAVEWALIWALFGAVSVVTLAITASVIFILVPSSVWYCWDWIRGARGHV